MAREKQLALPLSEAGKQSKIDSLMESLVNIVIGLVVSTIANHFVIPNVLHVQMTVGQNVLISAIFTFISLVRSYVLRRLFNGRSVWSTIKEARMFRFLRRKKPAAPVRAQVVPDRSVVPVNTPFSEAVSARPTFKRPEPTPVYPEPSSSYSSSSSYSPTPSYDPTPAFVAASFFDSSPSYDSGSSYDSSSSYSSSDSSFSGGGGDFGGGGSDGSW